MGGVANKEPIDPKPLPDSPVFGLCRYGEADLEVIDDMEDGDARLDRTEARAGLWFAFNDETERGTQEPAPGAERFVPESVDPARPRSRLAIHTYGSGFLLWGAGVGFDLDLQAPYPANDYAGLAFWARRGAGVSQDVRVEVPDRNTSPFGDRCTLRSEVGEGGAPVAPDAYECHDNFGAPLALTDEWRLFAFRWEELTQRNWSGHLLPAIDAGAVYGVRFQATQLDESNPKPDFDFWIDDVSFICPGR